MKSASKSYRHGRQVATVRQFVSSALKSRKQFTAREALDSYSRKVEPVTIHAVRRICRVLKDDGVLKVLGREQNHEVYTFAPVRNTKRHGRAAK